MYVCVFVWVCVWEREKKGEGGYFQQYLGSNRNLEISKNVRFTWLSVSFRRLLKNKWEGLDHIFGGKKCVMMISTKCFKFVFGQMRYFWRDSLEECAFYHNKFDTKLVAQDTQVLFLKGLHHEILDFGFQSFKFCCKFAETFVSNYYFKFLAIWPLNQSI